MHIIRIRRNWITGGQRGFSYDMIRGVLRISYISQRQVRFLSTTVQLYKVVKFPRKGLGQQTQTESPLGDDNFMPLRRNINPDI